MNQKELKELIEFLIEKDIAEFELERGDVKVRIKRALPADATAQVIPSVAHVSPAVTLAPVAGPAAQPAVAHPHPHTAAPATSASAAARPAEEEGLHTIQSPIVGTFYDAPSPGAPPFVKVGDVVEKGQVLCIIEAMKLMNEIESDLAGEIVKKLVNNGQPVEYGQALFAIKPR
ncbi:MAG TPA: acetyl-CoA carboxylase biotin carboxyl carrier protein [Terriglobales bacterium]|nr:acetyl-CoA carboxylase biotin carboxyl carrier protein [Terriglobales bacterium]